MKQYILLLVLMVMGAGIHAYAEDVNPVKEGNVISGHVVEKGTENSLPYATILIVETGEGTVSNEDGEFRFKKVPAGKYTLRVQLLGYETQEKKVTVSNDFTVDVHFLMSDESIMTDEVVVSANRNETSRKVAPVVVNVMNAKLFESVNSTDLAKSLNYQSGLRVENNCQNCGFPQVRINGLEGPYSQILINSRPVVSALSGVYGLEQIPVNMIERIEVVRGGGSALFGASSGRNHQYHHERPHQQFISGFFNNVQYERQGVGTVYGSQCLFGVKRQYVWHRFVSVLSEP